MPRLSIRHGPERSSLIFILVCGAIYRGPLPLFGVCYSLASSPTCLLQPQVNTAFSASFPPSIVVPYKPHTCSWSLGFLSHIDIPKGRQKPPTLPLFTLSLVHTDEYMRTHLGNPTLVKTPNPSLSCLVFVPYQHIHTTQALGGTPGTILSPYIDIP